MRVEVNIPRQPTSYHYYDNDQHFAWQRVLLLDEPQYSQQWNIRLFGFTKMPLTVQLPGSLRPDPYRHLLVDSYPASGVGHHTGDSRLGRRMPNPRMPRHLSTARHHPGNGRHKVATPSPFFRQTEGTLP